MDTSNVVNDVVEGVNDVSMDTSNVVNDVVRCGNDVVIDMPMSSTTSLEGGTMSL